MPIDYKKYPANWKTEIRPAILLRANNRCEQCNVENYKAIFRGLLGTREVFQDIDTNVYDANTGEFICMVGCGIDPLHGDENQKAIRIVLTIAHLDHDIKNNKSYNLKALCQRCHLRYDKEHHKANSKETRDKKMGNFKLDL